MIKDACRVPSPNSTGLSKFIKIHKNDTIYVNNFYDTRLGNKTNAAI